MSSSKKTKRQNDDSFRKNFVELRDAGVPNTGPKRPRNKQAISLTPASAVRARREPSTSGRRERTRGRGRGRGGGRGGGKASPGKPTPRTQVKTDIRNLINSAVELGDVIPAPSRTVLTPYDPTPQPNSRRHNAAASNTTPSISTPVNAQEEVREVETETSTAVAPAALADIVEETPTQETRVLRSALKGVHSLSSLRKRSQLSQTPHSVTFRDNITVAEYSPELGGAGSDFSLGSSSSSSISTTPSPLSFRPPLSAGGVGGATESGEILEPLEEEDNMAGGGQEEEGDEEEEGEGDEEEEEEEEEEEAKVKMRTPHLVQRPPSPSSRRSTTKHNRRQQKAAGKNTRKPKSSPTERVSSKAVKTLSRALIKNLFMLSGKRRMTADAAAMVVKFSEVYLKRCSKDLAEYASHGGRKTLEVDDVILLMKRQRFITETESFEYLVNTHLPLEYVEELLPCAVAGKKIVPTRVK